MIQVSDIFADSLLASDKYFPLREFFNKKIFRIKDTSAALTRRQIQSLDSDNLLSGKRKDEKKWRKFSLKELVYLLIVSDLKDFGLEHNQLRGLWSAFFGEDSHISEVYVDDGRVSELAIGYTFLKAEIIIAIRSNGNVGFYDSSHYLYFGSREPHIKLILNDYVRKVLSITGKKLPPAEWSLFSEHFKLSAKEEELMKIIRDDNYTVIKIKKKNGEIELVNAEKTNEKELTSQNLLKIINSKDFQDISVKKRDGKIVSLKIEEQHKL